MRRIAVVVVLALVAGVALGKGTEEGKEQVIRMEPPQGGWLVTDLLGLVSKATNQKFLYEPDNPAIRGRRVQLSGPVEVPADKLFRWLRATLSFQRLVVVPVGPSEVDEWMVLEINATQVGNRPQFVPEEDLPAWKDADGCYITTTITVKHLKDTARVRTALSQLSTRPNGKLNDVPDAHAFVIADFAPVVYAMWQDVQQMDDAAAKVAPPKPMSAPTGSSRRRELELDLVGSRTEAAAEYFVNQLRLLGEKAATPRRR